MMKISSIKKQTIKFFSYPYQQTISHILHRKTHFSSIIALVRLINIYEKMICFFS